MVAEAGFERCDLQVMGLTSYRAALLRDVLSSLLNIKINFKYKIQEESMMIKIFADAVSNLFPKILKNKKLDITVLKVHVRIGDKAFELYEDNFDLKEFNT